LKASIHSATSAEKSVSMGISSFVCIVSDRFFVA
jgi:hypothetical protein